MTRAALVCLMIGCGRVDFAPVADAAGGDGSAAACPHTFCDAFDRPPPVEDGWASAVVTGGSLTLDPAVSVSPTQSLRVDLSYPVTGVAYLDRVFGPTTTSAHVEQSMARSWSTSSCRSRSRRRGSSSASARPRRC